MEGRITRIISNLYTVNVGDNTFLCRARGKFRNDKLIPLVGDIVEISDENYILNIKERKNELDRPMIANVDIALVVTSLKRPEFSSFFLTTLCTDI